jgi:hypothetical protein
MPSHEVDSRIFEYMKFTGIFIVGGDYEQAMIGGSVQMNTDVSPDLLDIERPSVRLVFEKDRDFRLPPLKHDAPIWVSFSPPHRAAQHEAAHIRRSAARSRQGAALPSQNPDAPAEKENNR